MRPTIYRWAIVGLMHNRCVPYAPMAGRGKPGLARQHVKNDIGSADNLIVVALSCNRIELEVQP
jgi:hypothetical protein